VRIVVGTEPLDLECVVTGIDSPQAETAVPGRDFPEGIPSLTLGTSTSGEDEAWSVVVRRPREVTNREAARHR